MKAERMYLEEELYDKVLLQGFVKMLQKLYLLGDFMDKSN
jgi:hypothetical protein